MKRQKVTLDARMWRHAGIGRYISELSKALAAVDGGLDVTLLADASFPHAGKVSLKKTTSGIYGVAEQIEVPLKSWGADLLHVPHFNVPLFFPGKIVTTVHDLIYLRDPQSLRSRLGRAYAARLFDRVARKSSAIITVSANTKRDFLERFPRVAEEKIHVIPEAASSSFHPVGEEVLLAQARAKFNLKKPFVLFVGSLKPHKNVQGLIEALLRVRERHGLDYELVIVGRSDPKHLEILDFARRHSFVKVLGEQPDAELPALYTLADLFVLPSFYEGFGLPILEAMACGAPVLVSSRASLPEVAGPAGKIFDPGRVDAFSEALYTILKNKDLRQEMSRKGIERARMFSWKKTAEETVRIYQKVLGA